jgi:pre-mRNA-processing factor 6
MSKRNFLEQEAPANYVAGLGRGATGFTTRSDIGPAREGPSEEAIKAALARRAEQQGLAPPTAYGADKKKDEDDENDPRFQDPENEVGLFAGGAYDEDDDEADRIYQTVDEKMEKRRKTQRYVFSLSLCSRDTQVFITSQGTVYRRFSRELREKQEREEYEAKNPKIQQQFADLKRALSTVTDDEWANLPEVGDLTGRNRRARQAMRQKFYPTPDSVLAGAAGSSEFETSVQDDGAAAASNQDQVDGTMTNFVNIGKAKTKVLEARLDRTVNATHTSSDSASGATNIDPKGYLTSLSRSTTQSAEQIGDIKRVRELLESVIRTNPKHGPGWIAAARLEEVAGKMVPARSVIQRGCEHCPKNEDVWLEAMRLNETDNAKIIAANAVKHNPKSVRLWVEAMKLESDPRAKKKVIRKALDIIPQSVVLWKEAVKLEPDPNDAKILLARAVELIPLSVELWLALARLETSENAQAVLNKARKAVPTSHEIWLAAARLQEQQGNAAKINVMKRAVQALARVEAMPSREDWIKEAEKCEDEGAPETCHAIIRETLGWGLEEDDGRKQIWMDDAESCIARGKYETARAIYAYALRIFYNKKNIWRSAAELEKNHGTKEALWSLLEKAVEACPQSEVLWMMLAKEKWQAGEVDAARIVLGNAFKQNPNNEDIWLAAVKLEAENQQHENARTLLTTARQEAGTDRVWIKSVAFERQQGNTDAALELVNEGLQMYPKADKLWMMKGQIYENENKLAPAREAYNAGTKACPKSVPLWLLLARLEEKAGVLVRARSVLDRARLAVPKSPELWCESVRIERRAGNAAQAKTLMAKALQECPHSGLLWAESIWYLEARTHRRPRLVEAIEKVGNDAVLYVAVARNFWAERKLPKALSWFEKAILVDPDYGDTWAWYWKFLQQHGSEEKREDVLSKLTVTEPRHGEVWQRVAKDPRARFKNSEEILKAVAKELDDQ